MSANQGATVCVRILVDEEKNRVVCAEADNDFVDILFSFLTLPMGTIVRLLRKQQAQIGCLNNLYRSIELISISNFRTDSCKDMLLHPRNPCETNCRDLKVNVDDTEPTRYFICSDLACSRKDHGGLLGNYANARCRCGKLMNREIYVSGSGSNQSNANAMEDTEGVFLKGSTAFIITDNLEVMLSTPGALVELLRNLGIKYVNRLEERVLRVGSEEILNLLKHSLVSKTPLTDVFLPNQRFNFKSISLEPRDHQLPSQNTPGKATDGSMVVKILLRKSDGKALCAEAMEDFVDLLFSFLTIPLANVVNCLAKDSSLGCIDTLYASVQGLNGKWFVKHTEPGWLPSVPSNRLLYPGLAPKFSCSSQPFELHEVTHFYSCNSKVTKTGSVCSLIYGGHPRHLTDSGEVLAPLALIDPKSPRWERSSGEFMKRPAVFIVSDDLVVLPSSSTTSSISFLKGLDVHVDDVEEHVIKISKLEALNLLKASLITSSALTNVLNLVSKKPNQEL